MKCQLCPFFVRQYHPKPFHYPRVQLNIYTNIDVNMLPTSAYGASVRCFFLPFCTFSPNMYFIFQSLAHIALRQYIEPYHGLDNPSTTIFTHSFLPYVSQRSQGASVFFAKVFLVVHTEPQIFSHTVVISFFC